MQVSRAKEQLREEEEDQMINNNNLPQELPSGGGQLQLLGSTGSGSQPANSGSSVLSNSNNILNGSNQAFAGGNCCAGCREPIRDKFIFSVIDLNWHADCVQCSDCQLKLNERCYTFEGKLYCKGDYWRRFGPRCFACSESIERSELVQRIKGNRVYHLDCFTCSDCNRPLKAGEQLHLIDGKRLLCRHDFNQLSSVISNQQPVKQAPKSGVKSGASPNGANFKREPIYYTFNNGDEQELPINKEGAKLSAELNSDECQELEMLEELANDDQDSSSELGDQTNEDSMQFAAYNQNSRQPPANKLATSTSSEDLLSKGASAATSGAPTSLGLTNSSDCADDLVDANGKRRGPRTTIKPKQLETLRRAFETAPKPSRHIREQLAAETGLNMRVIQVWFQNRRSKERRMKNSNGSARRNFFRSSSRRIRVVPGTATGQPGTGTGSGQQSLMATGRLQTGGKSKQQSQQQQQQLSPLEPIEAGQMGPLGQPRQQHNSPSDFGGSSSGGFTYFSDSSNQGEGAFATQTTSNQQEPEQQALGEQPAQNPPAGSQPATGSANQARQYNHQLMKNTPPPAPAPQMHQNQQQQHQPYPAGNPNQHLMGPGQLQAHPLQQQLSHHQHQHHLHHQGQMHPTMQPAPQMGLLAAGPHQQVGPPAPLVQW